MYAIVKTPNNEWIMDESGNIKIMDTESNTILWIPQSQIDFTHTNSPIVRDTNIVLDTVIEEASNMNNEAERQSTINVRNDDETQTELCTVEAGEDTNALENNVARWEYDSTMALITAIEERLENMYHAKKKKTFWVEISEVLIAEGFSFDAMKCKKKWENLNKTYKSTKDLKMKTGRGPTRFPFFDRLDDLLGNKPNNSSPHTIDVAVFLEKNVDQLQPSTSFPENEVSNNLLSTKNVQIQNKRKRQTPATEVVKLKEKYYNNKQRVLESKLELYATHLKNMEEIQQQKLKLYEKRVAIEERKILALEKVASSEIQS